MLETTLDFVFVKG